MYTTYTLSMVLRIDSRVIRVKGAAIYTCQLSGPRSCVMYKGGNWKHSN